MKARILLLALCASILATAPAGAKVRTISVETASAGPVTIKIDDNGTWTAEASRERSATAEFIHLSLRAATAQVPPKVTVTFTPPLVDIHHVWNSVDQTGRFRIFPNWSDSYKSQLASGMPLYAAFNENNRNRLTVACSDPFRPIVARMAAREEGSVMLGEFKIFTEPESPISSYDVCFRFDSRDVFWAESISEAAGWIVSEAGLKPCNVPDAAFDPLYSTWYQFHQDVYQDELEEEFRLAASLGMKTIIVDDGWQTEDNCRGYAYTGDWIVQQTRFPDMAAHVRRVQDMGLKYMVWYSVPYVGVHSANFERFKGKYLRYDRSKGVLDPRFPEVREFLVSLYADAMTRYGYDGLKLDFIDQFKISGTDPAVAENYAGRDIISVPEATDVLMKEVLAAVQAVKPDALIEFRQSYIGPAIRQYGNMMRASDCGGDLESNRIRTTNLRLTSGDAAVHADMLEWNNGETAEDAARMILSCLFSTIQYSVMLRDLPEDHLAMMRHWIRFTSDHRQTLLHGKFLPYHPELGYPVLEAESDGEQIVAVYASEAVVRLGKAPVAYLVNSGYGDRVAARFEAKPRSIRVYDTFGNLVSKGKVKVSANGPTDLPIPKSGYAEIFF